MELKEIVFSDMTNKPNKNEVGFNHQTRVFQLLLSRYLKGIKTKDVQYLSVYCLEKVKEIDIDAYTIENGLTVKIPYNPIKFINLTTVEEKYNEYVRIINEYIRPVFNKFGWDFTPVICALEKIKEHNYHAEFVLAGTPKKSPDKNYSALVFGLHTVHDFKLIGKIYDKKGFLVKKEVLIEEVPNEFVYARFLGKPEWKDKHTFQVISKSSKWIGSVTID